MIRITKMSGKLYGIELPDEDDKAMREIQEFTENGDPVIVVKSLEDLYLLEIDEDDVIMVKREN